MKIKEQKERYELVCVIVKYGMASKIIKFAKKHGISGGTIFLGKGTINNSFLEFLELSEVRREIVLMVADYEKAKETLPILSKMFNFEKPNHGIAFSTSVSEIFGASGMKKQKESGGENNTMYQVIYTIVERGKAEDVVDAANHAGSKGATIINGRGSRIHETGRIFNMEIEPEKEIVLIISEKSLTEKITEAIRENLKIDEPGNGIVFIQNINSTYGLF